MPILGIFFMPLLGTVDSTIPHPKPWVKTITSQLSNDNTISAMTSLIQILLWFWLGCLTNTKKCCTAALSTSIFTTNCYEFATKSCIFDKNTRFRMTAQEISKLMFTCLFVAYSIFIPLSRESDVGAVFWTTPQSSPV